MIGGLAVLLAVAASTNARAQEAPALGPDSFLVVVPIRDTSEIQRELGLGHPGQDGGGPGSCSRRDSPEQCPGPDRPEGRRNKGNQGS